MAMMAASTKKPTATEPLITPYVIVVDTREQLPFAFGGIRADASHHRRPLQVQTVRRCLPAGDYSLAGHETQIAIERKSAADLFHTLGAGRRRFQAELSRLDSYTVAAVIVEADWSDIFSAQMWSIQVKVGGRWIDFANLSSREDAELAAKQLGLANYLVTPPIVRSQLRPKTIFRSVIAWQQRHPTVHWWFCPSRRMAEIATLRILERLWRVATAQTKAIIATPPSSGGLRS